MKNLIIGIIIGGTFMYLMSLLIKGNKKSMDESEIIKRLIRGAARWSTAAAQDENALIKTLHANYGAAYLWALEEFTTSSKIEKAANIDYLEVRKKVTAVQDMAVRNAVMVCPSYGPASTILTQIAGEG